MKKGDQRVTVSFLRTGQPRSYADTETVVVVTFEIVPWMVGEPTWAPWLRAEECVRQCLSGMSCGFTNQDRLTREDHFDTYLDYLRPINPDEDGCASTWEFRTVSPYTD